MFGSGQEAFIKSILTPVMKNGAGSERSQKLKIRTDLSFGAVVGAMTQAPCVLRFVTGTARTSIGSTAVFGWSACVPQAFDPLLSSFSLISEWLCGSAFLCRNAALSNNFGWWRSLAITAVGGRKYFGKPSRSSEWLFAGTIGNMRAAFRNRNNPNNNWNNNGFRVVCVCAHGFLTKPT